MQVLSFLNDDVKDILDIGCNAGALLRSCRRLCPAANLAGVDINTEALAAARLAVPEATILAAGAELLPFENEQFDRVFCTEVIEHIPPELRAQGFREMQRVLKPGGVLVLTVPHAGWFAWMDSNNVRFRLPRLYQRLVGNGLRDRNYEHLGRHVEWHEHFRLDELLKLAGAGWETRLVKHGGLLLYPLMDWLSWPFYRRGRHDHWLRRGFERIAGWDYSIDYGSASYGILLALQKSPGEPTRVTTHIDQSVCAPMVKED